MLIKLEWTDEIGDIVEKEFRSWDECFGYVMYTRFREIIMETKDESNAD